MTVAAARTATLTALGLKPRITLTPDETDTRVSMWDIRDLDAVFTRVGGTVTTRQVEHVTSCGTPYTVTEVTVTTDLPGIGAVEVFTDWDPAGETIGFNLPLLRALAGLPA
jgi:hypothetical protein